MLFQTQGFLLIFLPLVILLYYANCHSIERRVWVLLIGSAVFYGWWDVRFLPLLLGQTLATWLCAELFFRGGSRLPVWLGIIVNLAILACFKYADFFATFVEILTGGTLPRAGLILPIGISFYTFEMVSYLADLLRGQTTRYRLSRFSLFILYFPRLIAGPIVRHHEIIWQFELDPGRPGLYERLSRGFVLFVIGLAKKLLIADPLSHIADPIFTAASGGAPSLLESWSGLLAFALQLYFDFSAYSDMAIGLALAMGLTLPLNFDAPYRATSVQDFWRRWHMTLSRYIRDYVYISLGGSKLGTLHYVLAIMVSMTLCGLWHGAGWTFVAWGAFHGLGLVVQRAWASLSRPFPAGLGWILTMLFVALGWVLFRSPDFTTASHLYAGLFGAGDSSTAPSVNYPILALGSAIAVLGPTSGGYVERFLIPWRWVALFWACAFFYCVLVAGGANPVSFIYFQF